ncbi:MAG: hypothetical protein F4Z25_04720 [Chloroflexi bacterium]|nr:hypothetical protein [Chloroflexota bacterium]
MAGTIEVLNPRGRPHQAAIPLAPRPASLDGLRPGILENRKANAKLLLEQLVEGHDLGPTALRSKNASAPAPGSVLEAFSKEADFVLVGSCD